MHVYVFLKIYLSLIRGSVPFVWTMSMDGNRVYMNMFKLNFLSTLIALLLIHTPEAILIYIHIRRLKRICRYFQVRIYYLPTINKH